MLDRETANPGKAIKLSRGLMFELDNQVRNINLGIGRATDSCTQSMEDGSSIELAGEVTVTETLNACRMTVQESCKTIAAMMALYQDEDSHQQIAKYFVEALVRGLRGTLCREPQGHFALLVEKTIEELNQ